jgi:hypothetical protein
MRTLKTIAIVLGIYAAAILMEVVMVSSSPEYEGGIGAIVILAFLGFMVFNKKAALPSKNFYDLKGCRNV